MPKEQVKQFLDSIKNDSRAEELIKAYEAPADQEEECRIYSEIALKLGFDITEEDLKEYLKDRSGSVGQKTEDAAAEIQELPDDALDKVAGGAKGHDECKDTYEDRENCWFNDGCDQIYHMYPNYVCHRILYSDPCHETAKPCNKDAYCFQHPAWI